MTNRQNLKTLREEKGLTVGDMADLLGISVWHYYKIEQGSRNPNFLLAKLIADMLGASLESLFFEQELDGTSREGTSKEDPSNA